ncbi:helix-turn-helix domain-containing protein [Ulvibacterium sp.]|uniref:helix-turn-helix domain-containing protein n=1 Tax=Ulvibacterium sp. TaxID=2665914 RepID=UPI003BABDEC6
MLKDRLRKLRLENNLTQVTLGKISGVSNVQIGRYEKGLSKPTAKTLAKLARALDIDPGYFTDRDKFPGDNCLEGHIEQLKLVIKTKEDLKLIMALIDVLKQKNVAKSAH